MDTFTTETQDRVTELHQQAAHDYATAQAARDWQTNRDDANIHGPGRTQ